MLSSFSVFLHVSGRLSVVVVVDDDGSRVVLRRIEHRVPWRESLCSPDDVYGPLPARGMNMTIITSVIVLYNVDVTAMCSVVKYKQSCLIDFLLYI